MADYTEQKGSAGQYPDPQQGYQGPLADRHAHRAARRRRTALLALLILVLLILCGVFYSMIGPVVAGPETPTAAPVATETATPSPLTATPGQPIIVTST